MRLCTQARERERERESLRVQVASSKHELWVWGVLKGTKEGIRAHTKGTRDQASSLSSALVCSRGTKRAQGRTVEARRGNHLLVQGALVRLRRA